MTLEIGLILVALAFSLIKVMQTFRLIKDEYPFDYMVLEKFKALAGLRNQFLTEFAIFISCMAGFITFFINPSLTFIPSILFLLLGIYHIIVWGYAFCFFYLTTRGDALSGFTRFHFFAGAFFLGFASFCYFSPEYLSKIDQTTPWFSTILLGGICGIYVIFTVIFFGEFILRVESNRWNRGMVNFEYFGFRSAIFFFATILAATLTYFL